MGFEHRLSLRVKVALDLYFWLQGPAGNEGEGRWGKAQDLSVSGMAFRCAEMLPRNSELLLEFSLPGERKPLHLMAKVVLCERSEGGEAQLVRARFIRLEGEERQRLQQAVLQVSDPKLAAVSGWGKAYFAERPALELRYQEMPAGLREKWLADRSYLETKGLIYLKNFQDYLEKALGSRSPGAFRLLGSRALKEGSSAWVELALADGPLHALAQVLWCKQAPGERAEAGLHLLAFQKEEALRSAPVAALAETDVETGR